ncbi:MAG TPA: glutamine--tRNA ligase/YqeY domain fusion protein, partial [Rhodothermales bacterium]|nr:glutamine--tRNA ligase/YqeY domain fusion protein [Rhodothermales bacterium]
MEPRPQSHFIREIIEADVASGRHGGRVALRFPPEPNGYPHLGHAKSICLNFGLAERFGGTCNLRYDDTNPETEEERYVAAHAEAVRWLGFAPTNIFHASDYFEQLYEWAVLLVRRGLAYVDHQTEDEIRENRGTVTTPGVESPYRNRSVEENLALLEQMRAGEIPDGTCVLRARIDMAHPNMKLRDPIMYRIRRDAHHYRRGNSWKIYPLYDWAHGQSDAIEGITHSLCTLEFDVNRPLYDWYLDAIGIAEPRPHQYEFARFNLDYTVMSKRKLLTLVNEGVVSGWDDPRMPTLAGQRRRGVRPQAIRAFSEATGVSKVDGRIDLALYEHAIRDDLNGIAPRVMAVTRPLRLVLTNVKEGATEWIEAPLWPHDVTPPEGAPRTRPLPFTREVFVEHDDFAEAPPKGWHRLASGAEVRLRHAYVVRCTEVVRGLDGAISELRGEIVPETRAGQAQEAYKAKGVVHWVSAEVNSPASFRLYDRLFTDPAPDSLGDFRTAISPHSLTVVQGVVEPYVSALAPDTRVQFERLGFFWPDPEDSHPGALILNRIVGLRDSWAKAQSFATSVQEPRPKPAPAPQVAILPRDPAADLHGAARAWFDALSEQGVGAEEASLLAQDDALRALYEALVAVHSNTRLASAF